MATPQQLSALLLVYAQAKASGVIFPQAQACEVMVETTWLTSELGVADNNLFGMKQHAHPIYATVNLPTKEFLDGKWVVQDDDFVKYPTMAACFQDRTNTLRTLAPSYPHYAAALVAATPEAFLTQVSLTWSTGPTRGEECIEILHAHLSLFV
jgi:flagellum-specific peptidoglycan hydrolase FlgJ